MTTHVWVLTLILMMTCTSCGLIKTPYAASQYERRGNDINTPSFKDDQYLYEVADRFGLMAHFAQVTYREDLIDTKWEYTDSGEISGVTTMSEEGLEIACDYLASNDPAPAFGMPFGTVGDMAEEGRWERWKGSETLVSTPCYNDEGLFYETYVFRAKKQEDKLLQGVIAYRGTENAGSQFWYDWRTNLSNAFGIEPTQYKIAAEKLPAIVNALKAENPDIQIYAVGHSLGGGLAQQAGYLSRDIQEVFTFNTSPVTNWSSLVLRGEVENAYPIVHRIYNGGEVLGGIRNITTLFTNARYGRHDIGIQIKPKRLLAGHSMQLLSCHLACLIEDKGEAARFGYSPEYIRQDLMGTEGMCKGFVDFNQCELSVTVE